jgi:N6-adenosine-specific RNA methylase IME4
MGTRAPEFMKALIELVDELTDERTERKAKTVAKKVRRAEREREIAAKILALPGKRCGVILADAASALGRINATDIASIAAPDCALFLWAAPPVLEVALDAMEAWGIPHKTSMAWDKVIAEPPRPDSWWREQHELLLIGRRGKIPCPAPGTQWPSIIQECSNGERPQWVYEMLGQYFPTIAKIELNRRSPPRPGWHAWGNEVEEKLCAGGVS